MIKLDSADEVIESVVLFLLCSVAGLEHRQPINSFLGWVFYLIADNKYLAERSALLPFWAVPSLCEWQMCAVVEHIFAFRKSQNARLDYLQMPKAR